MIPQIDNERLRGALSITIKGFVVNLLLVIVKLLAGIFGRSTAMVADGLHSLSDTVSDVFLILGFRIADKPPDKTHRYGHGKFETLITVLISLMILLAGALIFWKSSQKIYSFLIQGNALIKPGFIAFVAAAISLIVKELLYQITRRAGIKYKSNALIANAWHHRTDAFSSVATFIGIGGAIILGNNWLILDPAAALLVSIFIVVVGVRLFKESIQDLLETSVGDAQEIEIIKIIRAVQGVLNPHNLKTRRVGNYMVIDVHIEVNSFLNVIQAHDIASVVERELREKFGNETLVSVHIEPFDFVK